MNIDDFPRLLGDIGGTNARFGWQANAGAAIDHVLVLPCAEHAGIEAAMRAYLARAGLPPPRACAIGIATAVTGDQVRMTNHHWVFSIEALKQALQLQRLVVMNDFTALALALPTIAAQHLVQVGGTLPEPGAAIALLGAGTGLGVSGLLPSGQPGQEGHWLPITGEGGHVSLAAQNQTEYQLIELLRRRHGHVSAERVLSGPGLVDLYLALRELRQQVGIEVSGAAEITQWALEQQDPIALQALEMFAAFLGSVAGDLALTLGARGGVYLGGGILPRWLGWFEHSAFRERFEAKGRFRSYLQPIPVWVITAPESPALRGAARSLDTA